VAGLFLLIVIDGEQFLVMSLLDFLLCSILFDADI
jgi:hypothetical protein